MAVRNAPNLSKSPHTAVAQRVLQKWRAVPDDPEMKTYLEIDSRFGPLLHYNVEPAVIPLALAAAC
jgi:hypothetical protein